MALKIRWLLCRPSACGAKIGIRRALLNRPDVVSIGVVWDSERPPADQVHAVLKAIGTTLRLCDVFQQVSDHRWAQTVHHELVGVVSYYGKHYTTFFFHTKLRVWVYFDDANVKEVGPSWEGVVEKCSRGRYQPLLLLYALPQPQQLQQQQQQQQLQHQQELTTLAQHRRAVTPSPEKASMGSNVRRAITPTPNRALPICDYQNLTVIQSKIFSSANASNGGSSAGEDAQEKEHYISRKAVQNPRRRDSGNWSGDRNSASSSSSTTLDNPYLYLVGKRQVGGSVPASPTRSNNCTNNGLGTMGGGTNGGQFYDAGYDSYSLSSTDSFPSKHQPSGTASALLMASSASSCGNGTMTKIPESVVLSGDCEKLCMEADQLLEKSRLLEDAHDLETALVLCHAAASKARAAMDAPYSNPHTMTFARMKHNTSVGAGAGSVLRNSPSKNIEIYATLPKKKVTLKLIEAEHIEPEPAIDLKAPTERESRSLFSRVTSDKDGKEGKEKRSRSEDRNKALASSASYADPGLVNAKDTLRKHKEEKDANDRKEKEAKSGKKQHKIRRKLLMGGLIRRKNRSMPDLTEAVTGGSGAGGPGGENGNGESSLLDGGVGGSGVGGSLGTSLDDSAVGLSVSAKDNPNSGYLSEGHFDYHPISNTNPNLERSKLMRKSFHGSGRSLSIPKVPPPPPVRIGSALTAVSSTSSTAQQQHQPANAYPVSASSASPSMLQMQKLPLNGVNLRHLEYVTEAAAAANSGLPTHPPSGIKPFHEANVSNLSTMSSNTSMSEDSCQTIITTCAVVHQEQSPVKAQDLPPPPSSPPTVGMEEVDSIVRYQQHQQPQQQQHQPQPIKLSVGSQLPQLQPQLHPPNIRTGMSGLLLADQQQKAARTTPPPPPPPPSASDNQLSDANGSADYSSNSGIDVVDCPRDVGVVYRMQLPKPRYDIAQSQIQEEIREVEMLNQVVQQTLNNGTAGVGAASQPNKSQLLHCTDTPPVSSGRTKKKSVSFCDQVILVATADEDEDDGFIPNPILERVLRTAGGGTGTNATNSATDSDTTGCGVLMSAGSGEGSPSVSQPATGLQELLRTTQ
uniref:USP domain-containing protein n=1 Tax=Anopheles culicifacies TaxID=139723 RepID=A0A182MU17_9DIPT